MTTETHTTNEAPQTVTDAKLSAGAVGLVYGFVYLGAKRNLWALILAHGLTDSVSFAVLYSGLSLAVGG